MVLTLGRLADAVPPLTPDGDEAREWAERELSNPVYQEAEPTLIDRIARAIAEFLGDLFNSEVPAGVGSTLAIIAAAVVVVLVVLAIVIWGVPRSTARRRGTAATMLFGEDETRSAAELRRAAADHAARGEWDAAVVLRFRALARGAFERGLVDTPPGATVHAFARATARAFPALAAPLEDAARAFDDVRYLRRPGTEELYRRVADVDDAVVAARAAVADEPVPAGAVGSPS